MIKKEVEIIQRDVSLAQGVAEVKTCHRIATELTWIHDSLTVSDLSNEIDDIASNAAKVRLFS